jgi:DnaJ family protein C protein 28
MNEGNQRPSRTGESAIEKQIREAIERGDFDHLRGQGKPLDLSENPFTPADWRLAFKLLQDASLAPDWIEQDKELRRDLKALESWLAQRAEWQRAQRARLKWLAPDKMIAEDERLARAREQTCAEYRRRAAALNKTIDLFNLKAPSAELHRERIRVEEEIQKFREE